MASMYGVYFFIALSIATLQMTNGFYGNRTFGIAGLFDMYQMTSSGNGVVAGTINPQIGIHFAEAYRFAIEQINKNKSLLYGYKIREEIATTDNWNVLLYEKIFSDFFAGQKALAAVGPLSSFQAYKLSVATNSLGLPLVTYANSIDNLDTEDHNHVFRNVPSDSFKVLAILELLEHLAWDFVSIVSSNGLSGDYVARIFLKKLLEADICYSEHATLPHDAENSDYEHALKDASVDTRAKVLILFTNLKDSVGILATARRLNLTRRFQIIAAWGFTNYVEVTNGNEVAAEGAISLEYETVEIPEFRDYFLALNPSSRSAASFRLFWEQTFGCSLRNVRRKIGTGECTGKEKLNSGRGYYPNTPVHIVINSVYCLAYAFRKVIEIRCRSKGSGYCDWIPEEKTRGYSDIVRKYLKEGSFSDYTLHCSDPITRTDPYTVKFQYLNYVKVNGKYINRKIGSWSINRRDVKKNAESYASSSKGGRIELRLSEVEWKEGKRYVESSCRQPCPDGHKQTHDNKNICCKRCVKCRHNSILQNNTCVKCAPDTRPDSRYRICRPLDVKYFKTSANTALNAYIVTGMPGVLLSLLAALVFMKHNNSLVIRESIPELYYFMLAGIIITFLLPWTFVTKPSKISCGIRGIGPSIAFCMCFSALFLKTNRIYRVLRSTKTSTKPVFPNVQTQLLILFGILGIQVLLSITWMLNTTSNVHKFNPKASDFITLHCACNTTMVILNYLPSLTLMISCTWYAFKTRNFPKNYSESKYIGFALYVLCVAWAVFLPMYLVPKADHTFIKDHAMCVTAIFHGYVMLTGLFGQRVKLLIRPQLENQLDDTPAGELSENPGGFQGDNDGANTSPSDTFNEQNTTGVML